MREKVKLLVISIASLLILIPSFWFGIKYFLQEKTKKLYNELYKENDQVYAYYLNGGRLDQALYAETIEDANDLIRYYRDLDKYYQSLESGKIQKEKIYSQTAKDSAYLIPVRTPLNTKYLSVTKKLFIKKNSENDSILLGYVFNNQCWGYYEAYLYNKTIHQNLPPKTLLTKFNSNLKNSLSRSRSLVFRKPSRYGFYCN